METIVTLATNTEGPSQLRVILGLCRRALFEPGRFFRNDLPRLQTSEALALGIGNAWVAGVIAFFVQTFNTLVLGQLLERWMQRLLVAEEGLSVWGLSATGFLYSAGLLLLLPFLFLLRAAITSTGLYLFARLLIEDRPGAPEPVTYTGALRIQAVSLVGHWFSVVPIFGGLLSFVVTQILTVTGVRERFGVSTRRATTVVLAPYVLLLFAALLFGLLLLLLVTQVPLEELLEVDPRQLGLGGS